MEINRFNGYQPITESPHMMLPVGGYIATIIHAKIEPVANKRQRILLYVEVAEGPYKGFFHQDYSSRKGSMYEAKYHGVYNIAVPVGDGTKQDDYDIIRFNKTLGAIESSNSGYHWNWKLEDLKGLTVGLSIRESEYKNVVFTEIGKFIPVSIIRDGHFRPMRRRISQDNTTDSSTKSSIPGTNQYIREQQQINNVVNPTSNVEVFVDADEPPF